MNAGWIGVHLRKAAAKSFHPQQRDKLSKQLEETSRRLS
jgi:hypothetical protein